MTSSFLELARMDVHAQRLHLEIDMDKEAFRGKAEIWVSTSLSRALFHCRQIEVTSVEVDGAATTWELADPLAEARQVRRHDVICLETWLRASMCANSQGELAVYLPASRQHDTYLVTIMYQLDRRHKSQAGVTFFGDGKSKGVRSVHRVLGSALASADFDAVRCWMPCVDAEPVRHPWLLDFGVVGATNLLVAASGSRVMLDADPFFQERANRASFAVHGCVPARAIGFVVLGVGYEVVVKPLLATHHLGRKRVPKKSDGEWSSQRALNRTDSTSSVMTPARKRLESSGSMSCFPKLTRVESMNLSGRPASPPAGAHSSIGVKSPMPVNFDSEAQLVRKDSHRDDLAAHRNHNRQHYAGPVGFDKKTVECFYPRHVLQRTDVCELAAMFADVVQFWHSWFSTTDASSGGGSSKTKSHSGCVADAGDTAENDLTSSRGSSTHFVVLVESLDVPFVPCVGLIVVDALTAKRATQHYDSLTRASSAETVVTSIVSSLTLKEIAVRDADSDEWVIHALVGAVVSRFVDRAQNRLRERLVRLTQATVAGEGDATRRPLSLVAQDDPPSWWRALEARSGANWLGAKAALVAHALEARLGRSTVRRAACRLRDLCCRNVAITIFDTPGFPPLPPDRKGQFLISTSRFLRACALEPLATQRGLAANVGNLDDLESTDDQIALTIDESVADFRQRWIESTGCSILECEHAFDNVKQMLELNVEQRVDDDRSFAEAAKLPICVRVVERDDTRDYYKFLDGFFHKWIFKSSFLTGAVTSTTSGAQQDHGDTAHMDGGRGPTPPPVVSGEGDGAAGGFGNGPAHDDEAVSVDSVMATARGLNRSPLLYMRLDPDFKLIRRVNMRQAEHAWIEQMFGDDDIGAQLEAIGALSSTVKLPMKTMADKMLAARALACVLRGVDHSIAVRCASANALAEWQRSESASLGSFSTFAASQLWRAFDERFKGPDGLLRPADFRRSHDGSDDQLALKTALAAAFGCLSDPVDRRQWPEAAERCLELLRDHAEPAPSDEDTLASERFSNEVYVETVLASLAKVAAKGDDAWLANAISQARRFLEWHLMMERNDSVAAAALATLYNLLAERDYRHMHNNQQEPEQSEDDQNYVHPSKGDLPDSARSLLQTYRHNSSLPVLVRAVALKLGTPPETLSRFSACDRGLAQQYFQSACSEQKGSDQADMLWEQLSSTDAVAFDQPWRVQLLEFYHALQYNQSDESQRLPEPLFPILSQVRNDKGKRIAPKRQRFVRDLDVTNPQVLKKIKINFTASTAVGTSRKTATPPPQVRLPAASNHDSPTPAMAATGEAPLDSSAIRPIAIRPSKPIVLARS